MTLTRAWNLAADAAVVVAGVTAILLGLSAVPPWLGLAGIGTDPTPAALAGAMGRSLVAAAFVGVVLVANRVKVGKD